jgi:uncharacterized circularly permuted ATP-grasp superfamily protein/uncharacterized alpha-E superfamily protein
MVPTRTQLSALPIPSEAAARPYDEMLDEAGGVRAHWRSVRGFFDRVGPEGITRRWREAERMVRDLGMVYHEAGGARAVSRPWRLDPVPFCLAAEEWAFIERATIQRARLLNRLLQDFYGKQETLKRGLVPAELVYYNPHYLRPCHGARLWQDHYLHLYAVDLARSPDGRWWVLADRTQAPRGLGYLMQNRIIVSRVFPEVFRRGHVRRLSDFFERWRDTLIACSPRQGIDPQVVVLTPGSHAETYFEQVFLSRFLGCPLVEGADLIVRDRRVFLKTLGGLHRVDVILRHLDEDFCDPLELRVDSLLGAPGLLSAIREGNVTLVNALGSGLVETPALSPFLPGLCNELLGEPLLIPPIATWWCGQPAECHYVAENLLHLAVRPAFDDDEGRMEFGSSLNAQQRADLRARIEGRPRQYVAQEHMLLSQAPVWAQGRFEARSQVLRVFAAFDGKRFFVLPGALCRAAHASCSYDVSMRAGGLAKDVWLVGERQAGHAQPLAMPSAVAFQRGSADLPSRIADRMFWLGRYAERTEFTARLMRSAVQRLSLEQGGSELDAVLPLLRTLAQQEQLLFTPLRGAAQETVERELAFAILDESRPGSLKTIIRRLLDNAAGLRDRLSQDTWLTLSELDALLRWPARDVLPMAELVATLDSCLLRVSAFAGQIQENMTRGYDLRFLELGRFLERAAYTARLVLESLPAQGAAAGESHEVVLEALDSSITYRQRYFHLQPLPWLDLVLADETNPRSLASQLREMEARLKAMPGEDAGHFVRVEEKLVHEGLSQIRLLSWSATQEQETVTRVARILGAMERSLEEVTHQLSQRYFSHVRVSTGGLSSLSPARPRS